MVLVIFTLTGLAVRPGIIIKQKKIDTIKVPILKLTALIFSKGWLRVYLKKEIEKTR